MCFAYLFMKITRFPSKGKEKKTIFYLLSTQFFIYVINFYPENKRFMV